MLEEFRDQRLPPPAVKIFHFAAAARDMILTGKELATPQPSKIWRDTCIHYVASSFWY